MWKVGAVGSGIFALGVMDALYNPPEKRIGGGYYQPGKRDPKDVPFGHLRIGGVVLPHVVSHNLLSEVFQMGETFARVGLQKFSEGKFKDMDEFTKIAAGFAASYAGVGIEAPLAGPTYRISQDISRAEYNKIVQDSFASLIPTMSGQLARLVDPKTGKITYPLDPVVREPKGIPQAIEQEIPFARQLVPLKKPKYMTNSYISNVPQIGEY